MKRFWGDNFYDSQKKKWVTESETEDGRKLQRGFVQFIMNPIIKLMRAIMSENIEEVLKITTSQDIKLSSEEKELRGKDMVRNIFMKWINAGNTIFEMIVMKLPSPREAQRYRTAQLYEGPQDDICAEAMRNCDPNGPLMIYISKQVLAPRSNRFYAFGRVFSGTVRVGQKVRIMGPNYVPGKTQDLHSANIQNVVLMMAGTVQPVQEVPCGNTVGLVGIDKYLSKQGTITDCDIAHNIRQMKFSVSPVVRMAIKPKNASDLPKLIKGLQNLSKADQLVQCYTEETGEHIIAGSGELHLEVCLRELTDSYAQIPLEVSEPVVNYKETITANSSQVCLSKSQNKHNRLYATAEPLEERLARAIEDKTLDLR